MKDCSIRRKLTLYKGFAFALALGILGVLGVKFLAPPHHLAFEKQQWSFEGPFGTYDKAALQRGFQVYKEVCATCHSLKRLRFRELSAIGFNNAEIKALAATYQVKTLNDAGEEVERPALPSDSLPSPYANDLVARSANNGALPPDQSLIIKGRPHGADYAYALLTHFGLEPPKDVTIAEGRHYNPIMAGGQIAMAPPLKDDQVTYADGTKATIAQMSHDVVTFLSWVSEPEMESRKQTGVSVLLYLLVMTGVLYTVKRRVWKNIH